VRSTVVASLPRIITPFGGWESAAPPRPRRAGAPVERSSESTAHHGVGAAIVREDRPVAYGSNGTDRMPALRRKSALQHAYRARPSAPTSVPPPQRAGSHGVLGAARAFAARECRLAVDTLGLAFRRMLTMSLALGLQARARMRREASRLFVAGSACPARGNGICTRRLIRGLWVRFPPRRRPHHPSVSTVGRAPDSPVDPASLPCRARTSWPAPPRRAITSSPRAAARARPAGARPSSRSARCARK
jgi:hypothetical protein